MKKLRFEDFVKKAREVHGDKFIYHEESFNGSDSKTLITCKIHGDFYQKPYRHLKGQGCPRCAGFHKTTDDIVEEFKKVHGDRYDYSKVDYIGFHSKVCIICKKHGEFWITPANHLNGRGCPKCKSDKLSGTFSMGTDKFVEKAREVHGNAYDYSKVDYKNNVTKVEIICHEKDTNGIEHGSFIVTPATHLRGSKCPKCTASKMHELYAKTKDEFIKNAIAVHGSKYDYSNVNYINGKTNVEIICPIHGLFTQNPNSHLNGRGCPLCIESHLEREVELKLNGNADFVRIKRYKWLEGKSLDFYLPKYNAAIECQGIQHFEENHFFDKKESYTKRLQRDIKKKQLCEEHGIRLYYFSHENYDECLGEKVYHDFEELFEKITQ